MNMKLMASCLVAGALILPVTVYAADTVSTTTTTTKSYVTDSVITTKVKAELADAKMSSLLHVGVDTDSQGMVTLSGTAPTQKAADRAATIARGVDGVTSVDNQIRVISM
jgi:hyperosmotically inducible protein